MQMIQQQMQQMGPMMQNPQAMQQNPQAMQMQQRAQQLTSMMEARKAVLIAEMTMDYAKEEDKISSEVGGDPLLKLKSRELDLKARADQDRTDNKKQDLI